MVRKISSANPLAAYDDINGEILIHTSERRKLVQGKVPSLVYLCAQSAIDNVRYIGKVTEKDEILLGQNLPHCTINQLMHRENATEGRDLSPVTDKLWKKFYEAKLGAENTNKLESCLGELMYPDQALKESLERLAQLYKGEDAHKPSLSFSSRNL